MARIGTTSRAEEVPGAKPPQAAEEAAKEPPAIDGSRSLTTASVLALQGGAGNAAVARLLDARGTPGAGGLSAAEHRGAALLQRQPQPAAPPTAPPATEVDPQTAAVEGMRLQLPGLINKAYLDYSNAVNSVRSEIVAKKIETPPPTDPMNVILAVGMALVPWEAIAVKAASAILNGPLRDELKAAVISYFIRTNPLPFSKQTLEDKAVEALASAAGAMGIMSNEDRLKTAYKGVAAGWQEIAKGAVVGSTELQQTLSFLDACIDEASKKTLTNLTGKLADNQVAALWAAYANPNLSLAFRGSVRAEAQHFVDVLAKKPSERGKTITFRPTDAYGRRRWVKLRYNTTDARYHFLAWVPKDVEPLVEAANGGPNAEVIPSDNILGPLPDPVIDQERVVRVDAWGELRLARVIGEKSVMHFRAWIPKSKYPETEAEAQHQIGGLETVPADSVHDKVAPALGE
jgi:hypothetical protein